MWYTDNGFYTAEENAAWISKRYSLAEELEEEYRS